jgi:hypothetical protein
MPTGASVGSSNASEFAQAVQTKAEASGSSAAALTPNDIKGGSLPSGHALLTFALADGNWVREIELPKQAKNHDAIVIRSEATFGAKVLPANVENPETANLALARGESLLFVYYEESGKWHSVPKDNKTPVITASEAAGAMQSLPSDALMLISDSDSHVIQLPEGDYRKLSIYSSSSEPRLLTSSSEIISRNAAGTQDGKFLAEVARDQLYNFWYDGSNWTDTAPSDVVEPNSIPVTLTPNDIKDANLPSGYAALTLNLSDGNWEKDIELPRYPRDGDSVIITSKALYTSFVDMAKVDTAYDSLEVHTGQSFTFVYHASTQKWTMETTDPVHISPKTAGPRFAAGANLAPRTYYELLDGNWTKEVMLPATAKFGDVIVVSSSASLPSTISAPGGINLHLEVHEPEPPSFPSFPGVPVPEKPATPVWTQPVGERLDPIELHGGQSCVFQWTGSRWESNHMGPVNTSDLNL